MKAVLITDNDFKALLKSKSRDIEKAYKKFSEKKKIHLKDKRLQSFYKLCSEDFNPMLYTIPFKCYFSFYLYLYLKTKVKRFDFDIDRFQFVYSKPMDINISEISRLAGVPVNTVKSAVLELLRFGYLIYMKQLSPAASNLCKSAMLVNDFLIVGHDSARDKTCFYTKHLKFTT
ncbi:MAG: hypothetical protein IPN57_00160 [Ignavibacteria bacterium]|nr:hypothetical protein [Ignavibacteria bacterium]